MNIDDVFSHKIPCVYKGMIVCSDCDNDECDMRQGREIQRQMFVSGYRMGIKEREDRLKSFLEGLEVKNIDDLMENADAKDMKFLGERMADIMKKVNIMF